MDLLLITRGLAALAVVVWHVEGYRGALPSLLNVPGRTAVWIFFGISGYVIAHGFVHARYALTLRDLKWFYFNRFLRIYPLFLVLSLIAWGTEFLRTGSSPITWANFAPQLFALQFHQDYVLNGVFWTLGIEIQFYLLAPLLVAPLFIETRASRYAIAIALFVAMVYWNRYAASSLGWSYDGRNIVSNLSHFFVGMIGCSLVSAYKPDARRAAVTLAAGFALLAYTNWLYHNQPSHFWSWRGIVLVDLMILLLIMAHASLERRDLKRTRLYAAFALLGVLSYGIYGWHAYLMKYIPSLSSNMLALIIASIAAAYASYRLIERRALSFKQQRPLEPLSLCHAEHA